MTNNTPDYEDNLYFESNTMQANDVADNKIQDNLTEQWKKGELPEGRYFVNVKGYDETTMLYYWSDMFLDGDVPLNNSKIIEILAPVPSYDEWFKIKNLASLSECLQEKNIECLHSENSVKELLKECIPAIVRVVSYNDEDENALVKLHNKIIEVLR